MKHLKHFLKTCKNSLLDFFYPALCLQCYQPLNLSFHIFCADCFKLVAFTNPKEHCKACYHLLENPLIKHCLHCQKQPSPFFLSTSPFLQNPVIQHLSASFYQPLRSYLTKPCASLMAYHYLKQSYPWPDYITYIPPRFTTYLKNGLNPSKQLATYLSHYFKVPVLSTLQWNLKAELTLKATAEASLINKTILLINHDSYLMREAGLLLGEAYPKKIIGQVFSLPEI